jgi:hypothetical protein
MKSYVRQPDSGNPTVRDENGGLMKCGLWYFGLRHKAKAMYQPPKPEIAHASNLSKPRSVLLYVNKKDDKQSRWLKNLMTRAGYNKTAVALANKIARMAWAIVKEGTNYNVNYKPVFLKTA